MEVTFQAHSLTFSNIRSMVSMGIATIINYTVTYCHRCTDGIGQEQDYRLEMNRKVLMR